MAFRIVVPVDGSQASLHSLAWAIAFAVPTRSQLCVCSVLDPMLTCAAAAGGALIDPRPMLETMESDARMFVAGAVAKAVDANVAVTSAVLEGDASVAICEFAREHDAEIIVLGAHGRQGLARGIAGSVTDDVVRATNAAIVTVRSDNSIAGPGSIVVAVDDSAAAAAAVRFARAIARALQSSIHLVHIAVGSEPDREFSLDALARAAASAGVACTTEVRRGDIIDTLIGVVAERGASLIATGTHGRNTVGRFVFGSVAAGLIRRSTVPVLVVRRQE
jgi:nucleotide-binding universal stress UspA family protein